MGARQKVEQELYPDKKFDGPAEVYGLLARISLEGVDVGFQHVPEELGLTGEDLEAAAANARDFLANRVVSRSTFADFGNANTDRLDTLASLVRNINQG